MLDKLTSFFKLVCKLMRGLFYLLLIVLCLGLFGGITLFIYRDTRTSGETEVKGNVNLNASAVSKRKEEDGRERSCERNLTAALKVLYTSSRKYDQKVPMDINHFKKCLKRRLTLKMSDQEFERFLRKLEKEEPPKKKK